MGFENPYSEFELIIPLPRHVFSNREETLLQANLYPKALLTVKEIN